MTSLDILNHLWQSTAAGLALLALVLLCAPLSARTRRALGFMGLAKFALPLGLLLPLLPRFGSAPERWLASPALTLPANFPVGSAVTATSPVAANATVVAPAPGIPIGSLLIATWFLGFAALFSAWLGRGLRLRRRILATALPAPAGMEERVAAAAERVGLRRLPRCVTLDDPGTVGVLGILSPILILPRGLEATLTPAEFEAVLLHELVHVQRRDNLWAALQALLVSVFWFHPLVWLLNRQVSIEAEKSCDERVLAVTGNADAYASGIVKCVHHALGLTQPGLAGVATPPVVARLKNILTHEERRKRPLVRAAALSLGVAFVASSGCAGSFAPKARRAATLPAAASTPVAVAPAPAPVRPNGTEEGPLPRYRYNATRGSFEVYGYDYRYTGKKGPDHGPGLSLEFVNEETETALKVVADAFELHLVLPGPQRLKGRVNVRRTTAGWHEVLRQILEPGGYTFFEDGNLVRVVRTEEVEALLADLPRRLERNPRTTNAAETLPVASGTGPDPFLAAVSPSEAFHAFVQALNVRGALPDSAKGGGRILANNRLYRVGDILDRSLGIRLVAVNFGPITVVLEEASGARLSKQF